MLPLFDGKRNSLETLSKQASKLTNICLREAEFTKHIFSCVVMHCRCSQASAVPIEKNLRNLLLTYNRKIAVSGYCKAQFPEIDLQSQLF